MTTALKMQLNCKNCKKSNKQVWLWPNKAPGIVGSGLYDITIQCGSKDMSLETYILIVQKI